MPTLKEWARAGWAIILSLLLVLPVGAGLGAILWGLFLGSNRMLGIVMTDHQEEVAAFWCLGLGVVGFFLFMLNRIEKDH